jgi:hypothetical protein
MIQDSKKGSLNIILDERISTDTLDIALQPSARRSLNMKENKIMRILKTLLLSSIGYIRVFLQMWCVETGGFGNGLGSTNTADTTQCCYLNDIIILPGSI